LKETNFFGEFEIYAKFYDFNKLVIKSNKNTCKVKTIFYDFLYKEICRYNQFLRDLAICNLNKNYIFKRKNFFVKGKQFV
jgi:hypothetical protein